MPYWQGRPIGTLSFQHFINITITKRQKKCHQRLGIQLHQIMMRQSNISRNAVFSRSRSPRHHNLKANGPNLTGIHMIARTRNRRPTCMPKQRKKIGEYVGRTYKYGANIRQAIETLAVPTLTEPTDPPTEATRSQIRIWEKRIDEFVKKETHLEENRKSCTLLSLGNVPKP